MMDDALRAFAAIEGGEAPAPEAPAPEAGPAPSGAPAGDEARAAWIADLVGLVTGGDEIRRKEALRSLVLNDKDGDCLKPLVPILSSEEHKKNEPVMIDVIRALGRPGLNEAAAPVSEFLKHRSDLLRAEAAVTLEYIGSPDSVRDLLARVKSEKVPVIACHIWRAVGRCGIGDAKVRERLLKEARSPESDDEAFGPIVGLAYFEKDEKAARGVEKALKALGPPTGGRGAFRGTMPRALLAWCLAEIGDPKSAPFMREEMLAPMENVQGWWKGAVVTYYDAVARVCAGDESAKGGVDTGVRGTLEFTGGTARFRDDARKGREGGRFEPKGEWELEARQFGGGGGGPGGGGGR
jgi:hypothetical protein